MVAAQACDGGGRRASESSTASPRPGRPLLLLLVTRETTAPTASQHCTTGRSQCTGYIVGGSWPPAVEEMSRPLQGWCSGGVKTAARSNGRTVCQTLTRSTRSKDGSIGMGGLRCSLGSCWAYMCVCAGAGAEDAFWPLHPGVLRLCGHCRVCCSAARRR